MWKQVKRSKQCAKQLPVRLQEFLTAYWPVLFAFATMVRHRTLGKSNLCPVHCPGHLRPSCPWWITTSVCGHNPSQGMRGWMRTGLLRLSRCFEFSCGMRPRPPKLELTGMQAAGL